MTVSDTVHDPAVWEQVWKHAPSDAKDRARLERERRGDRWRVITEALVETFARIDGLRTLELGAGRGDFSLLLASQGADVTLLDRSTTALEQAEARLDGFGLRGHFVHGDLFNAASDAGSDYDVVLSLGVIEHFRGVDRLRSLEAHRSAVRPGGLAVISVPNAACVPYRLWKAYLELRGWWPYGMEIPYSRRELARLAAQAGFDRRSLSCSGFLRSLGDQVCRTFLRWQPRWVDRGSGLDAVMGFNLLLLAWTTGRPGEPLT